MPTKPYHISIAATASVCVDLERLIRTIAQRSQTPETDLQHLVDTLSQSTYQFSPSPSSPATPASAVRTPTTLMGIYCDCLLPHRPDGMPPISASSLREVLPPVPARPPQRSHPVLIALQQQDGSIAWSPMHQTQLAVSTGNTVSVDLPSGLIYTNPLDSTTDLTVLLLPVYWEASPALPYAAINGTWIETSLANSAFGTVLSPSSFLTLLDQGLQVQCGGVHDPGAANIGRTTITYQFLLPPSSVVGDTPIIASFPYESWGPLKTLLPFSNLFSALQRLYFQYAQAHLFQSIANQVVGAGNAKMELNLRGTHLHSLLQLPELQVRWTWNQPSIARVFSLQNQPLTTLYSEELPAYTTTEPDSHSKARLFVQALQLQHFLREHQAQQLLC